MLLLIDDDPKFLESARELLDTGEGVFMAGSAEQAKELITRMGHEFSLVLIDLDLPGQDGFSLIRDLRKDFPDLPVVAISGVSPTSVLESAKLLGAVDALRKPINAEWEPAIRLAHRKITETG